jgi:hypothetical protein
MSQKEEDSNTVKSLQEQVNQLTELLEAHSEKLEEMEETIDNCRTIADDSAEKLQGVSVDELSEIDVDGLVELMSMAAEIKEAVEKVPGLEEAVEVLVASAE